jgi:hypothetical protein
MLLEFNGESRSRFTIRFFYMSHTFPSRSPDTSYACT